MNNHLILFTHVIIINTFLVELLIFSFHEKFHEISFEKIHKTNVFF
jgi:hypothetical protein